MTLPAVLVGKTLGETIYRCVFVGLALAAFAVMGWAFVSGKFWAWRAETWKDRAVAAAAEAQLQARQAKQADSLADNASQTRGNIDEIVVTVRDQTDSSARRIENHVPSDAAAAAGVPDQWVLDEVEQADAAYRAAADRLRRARTGRTEAERTR